MHQFHRPIRGPEPSGSNLRQAQDGPAFNKARGLLLVGIMPKALVMTILDAAHYFKGGFVRLKMSTAIFHFEPALRHKITYFPSIC
jgi:hypothetical protein